MRRGWVWGSVLGWGVTLVGVAACAHRAAPSSADQRVAEFTCALEAPPAIAGDSASLLIRAVGAPAERCALALAAEWLRPWSLATTSEPWTVQLTLAGAAVIARRLDAQRARDAIDHDDAVYATEDASLAMYASARADLEVTPLPWDRTYLLLSSDTALALGGRIEPDAVRADARIAEPAICETLPPASVAAPPRREDRILHLASDRTAREIAERLVAVLGNGRVLAATPAEFEAALRAGEALAYVVSVPRSGICDALASMPQRAPWIDARVIAPVLDTRAHAIQRRSARP
jgi:hypothetical protein